MEQKAEGAGASGQADFQKCLNLGVNGTPTFFINGKMLVGLQPVGVFENAIEDARWEAEGG
jgi:protein-disulfide isomerase